MVCVCDNSERASRRSLRDSKVDWYHLQTLTAARLGECLTFSIFVVQNLFCDFARNWIFGICIVL